MPEWEWGQDLHLNNFQPRHSHEGFNHLLQQSFEFGSVALPLKMHQTQILKRLDRECLAAHRPSGAALDTEQLNGPIERNILKSHKSKC